MFGVSLQLWTKRQHLKAECRLIFIVLSQEQKIISLQKDL